MRYVSSIKFLIMIQQEKLINHPICRHCLKEPEVECDLCFGHQFIQEIGGHPLN